MSIHHSAINHLDKARRLLDQADYDSLRYAVLELRYGIECLVYELLPKYAEELSDEVREGWRPSEMLLDMVGCDPDLPHTASLAIGIEGAGGSLGPAYPLGTQTGLDPKALSREYSRLGSFLHAQKPDGRPHDD